MSRRKLVRKKLLDRHRAVESEILCDIGNAETANAEDTVHDIVDG